MDRAKGDLTPLEEALLTTLLRHDHPTFAALRRQQDVCRVESREFTGVGFFTTLTVSPDQAGSRVTATAFELGDVEIRLHGLEHGAGVILFVRDGFLDVLEGFTYDEPWPTRLGDFAVSPSIVSGSDSDVAVVERLARQPEAIDEPRWMRFKFNLSGHGSATAAVADEVTQASIPASYVSDALGDLLYAVWRITQGDSTSRCSWEDEPGEWRWIMTRDGGDVFLRILRFDSSHPPRTDERGELIYETRQDVGTFARAIALGASRTLEMHGEEGFVGRWGRSFPTRTLAQIQAELQR